MGTGFHYRLAAILSRGDKPMLSSSDIDDVIAYFDVDGDGMLSIEEFAAAISECEDEEMDQVLVRTAFKIFDTSKSGKISKDELMKVLLPGELATPAEIQSIIKAFDANSDGQLCLQEFETACGNMDDTEAKALLLRLREVVNASS